MHFVDFFSQNSTKSDRVDVVLWELLTAEGGVRTSAEGVDEHVDLTVLVLIKDIVHIVGIEVISSDLYHFLGKRRKKRRITLRFYFICYPVRYR